MTGLTGIGLLLRLALRRDRVLIPVSILALTALSVGSAQATVALYPDANTAVRDLGSVLGSPSTRALYGPATTTSLYGLSIFKTLLAGAVGVGVLAYAIVRRHSRIEEEDGRLELIAAGVVARQAPLTAAVVLASATTLLTAAVSASGLMGIGFAATGSLAFGAAWAIGGLVMTGVTAVACQLTTSARGAAGWALGTLGALYALRAIGDSAGADGGSVSFLHWLSPLGWVNQVFPFGRNRIWLLGLAIAVAGALVAAAFALLERRDLGAGLLASRPGPATASASLSGPVGLMWRLGRPPVIGWAIAATILGAVYGSLLGSVDQMLEDPNTRRVIAEVAGVPVDRLAVALGAVYSATMLQISAAIITTAGVALVLRLGAEERSGRAEAVLATPASRTRWYLGHVIAALLLVAGLVLLMATVLGAVGTRALAAAPTVADTLQGASETIPAAWVILAVAALLFGLGQHLAGWAWGALAVAFVLGEFGTTMRLPRWLVEVSPFAHVHAYPLGAWDVTTDAVLLLLALILIVAGLITYRRRDLA